MHRNTIALTALGFVAGVATTLATLGGGAQPVVADQAESAYLLAQKAQAGATTYQLDKAGLHDIDEGAKAGAIPAGALGNVRRARIATQATEWPDDLKPMADALVADMRLLEEAIRSEDPARAVEIAAKVHDGEHDFSAAVYSWLETGRAPEGGHGH